MNEVQPKGRVVVYACGGAAINIARQLNNVAINKAVSADFEIVMVDTSRSNLSSVPDNIDCYLVEGLDGSGKVRSENSGEITKHIKQILQDHKPGDANIILSSGAGGSGSVIAPLLTSRLLELKIPAIVLMVGSTSSKLEAENTLKTMKSYEAIAAKHTAPVIMSYLQNSDNLPRAEVDRRMIYNITSLGILFSRRNRELDSKDLQNWLRYNSVTSYQAQLATLSIFWHDPSAEAKSKNTIADSLAKVGNIISVATLAPDGVSTTLPKIPEYQTVGILSDEPTVDVGTDPLKGKILNYVISDGMLPQYVKGLNTFLAEVTSAAEARPPTTGILAHGDRANDDGLVL